MGDVVDMGAAKKRHTESQEKPSEGQVWKVADVMAFTKMGRTWVYEAARTGAIPCRRLGSALRFDADEVRAWWARQGKDGGH